MRQLMVLTIVTALTMPAVAQDAPPAFDKCRACHEVGQDAPNKVGPQLNGLVGEAVASEEQYTYSQALLDARRQGMVWTRQALTLYLKRPSHFLPGTKMTFYGMQDRAEIEAIIDYLASFGANGSRIVP